MTGTMKLAVSVGGEGSKSSVYSNGTIIVEADRGESGDDGDNSGHPSSGGDGYCGGGGGGSDHAAKGEKMGRLASMVQGPMLAMVALRVRLTSLPYQSKTSF